jgi:hypothetical protein
MNTKLAGFEVHTAVNEGAADFCLPQNVRTGPDAHPTSFSVGFRLGSRRSVGRGVKSTTRLCVVPKLRMSGAILCSPMCLYGVERENFTLLQWIITHVCDVTSQSTVESFRL